MGVTAPSPPSHFPPGTGLKTVVRCPELPGEIMLGLRLCYLPDQQWGRHVQRLMQTWGETQFFVFKTLLGPSPTHEASPRSHQPWAEVSWVPEPALQHPLGTASTKTPSSLALTLPTALPALSTAVIHHLLSNITGQHCFCATPSLPSPLLPCAIIALVAVGSTGARLSWEAGHGLPLPCRIMGSSPDLGSWCLGERSACISAPAQSSASPPSLLTRVPISVSRTGSR